MTLKVLVLCTGNSARSILAEAVFNRLGEDGRFAAWSAGSFPKGEVHPEALALLQRRGHPTKGLRSKSWDEFAKEGSPEFDLVVTVCDNAAGEVCPVWFGQPVKTHWSVPDPAAVAGPEVEQVLAFEEAYRQLRRRIEAFAALPVEELDRAALKAAADEIGRTEYLS